jgi:hypothetical protein
VVQSIFLGCAPAVHTKMDRSDATSTKKARKTKATPKTKQDHPPIQSADKSNAGRKVKEDVDGKELKCRIVGCTATFPTYQEARNHEFEAHIHLQDPKDWKCRFANCDFQGKKREHLRLHNANVHHLNYFACPYTCDKGKRCSSRHNVAFKVRDHIERVHGKYLPDHGFSLLCAFLDAHSHVISINVQLLYLEKFAKRHGTEESNSSTLPLNPSPVPLPQLLVDNSVSSSSSQKRSLSGSKSKNSKKSKTTSSRPSEIHQLSAAVPLPAFGHHDPTEQEMFHADNCYGLILPDDRWPCPVHMQTVSTEEVQPWDFTLAEDPFKSDFDVELSPMNFDFLDRVLEEIIAKGDSAFKPY